MTEATGDRSVHLKSKLWLLTHLATGTWGLFSVILGTAHKFDGTWEKSIFKNLFSSKNFRLNWSQVFFSSTATHNSLCASSPNSWLRTASSFAGNACERFCKLFALYILTMLWGLMISNSTISYIFMESLLYSPVPLLMNDQNAKISLEMHGAHKNNFIIICAEEKLPH